MIVLRATQKILKGLAELDIKAETSDTALGDWYVNRIVVDRQPLLLLVSSLSRLAILVPARDVKNLPDRLGAMVAGRLERLGVPQGIIEAEVKEMQPVRVGRTQDRSVTGQMVDFAKAIPYYLPVNGWDEAALRVVEDRLGKTPCLCGRVSAEAIWPAREALRLLVDRWSRGAAVD
jgi:hypothetical protein